MLDKHVRCEAAVSKGKERLKFTFVYEDTGAWAD